jgi:hypothetical protein
MALAEQRDGVAHPKARPLTQVKIRPWNEAEPDFLAIALDMLRDLFRRRP